MSDVSDTEPVLEQVPPSQPAPGQITVTAAVKVRGLEIGVPTLVADDDEWRALQASGLVEITE